MLTTRSKQREWKNTIQCYLNAPYTATVTPKPAEKAISLWNLSQLTGTMFLAAIVAILPALKRTLKNAIRQESDTDFDLRLTAIEQASPVVFTKKLNSKKTYTQQACDETIHSLFQFKTNSGAVKADLLYNMQVSYFAADQDKIKEVIGELHCQRILKDEIFKPYCDDEEFKIYFKKIINDLLRQSDAFVEAYTKYLISRTIKYMGYYNRDKLGLVDSTFETCCERALDNNIINYKFDRSRAKAVYVWTQGYKQSDQSALIDSWLKILYVTGAIFPLSIALWLYDYPILGPLMAMSSGLIFSVFLVPTINEIVDSSQKYAANIIDKVDNLLDIKLVENRAKQIFEFKLESRIPAVPRTENTKPSSSSFPFKKLFKRKFSQITGEEVSIIPQEEKSTAVEKQRTFAGSNGNIYYLLANNSYYRYNATELDARRESINNKKLTLSFIMKSILDKTDTIGSTNSEEAGLKYVGEGERRNILPLGDSLLKFKFQKKPYGYLRIFMNSRRSTAEETDLLKGEKIIHSPCLYEHK